MNMRSVVKVAVVLGALLAGTAGCSRNHIEAINLANEGDQAVKVNVEDAISKYQQALDLDPTDHRIIWKLAVAYEKKEDWDKMASTLSRAVQVAPEHADYWYKRGYALIKLAENGNPDGYEEAKEPLKKCVEKDPNFSECYFNLAEADLWTSDDQGAIDNYTKAIEHGPDVAYFYPPLAELYMNLKFYKEAEQVLKEGTSIVKPTEKARNALYGMYVLRFGVAQALGDQAGMVTAMEEAQKVAGDDHPEIGFNLGSTYAVMDPPQKEKAVRLLSSFSKRACKGAAAKKFQEQCATSQSLIQKLGGKLD
ncbi:MAG: tetratricopeptide repeat protein [Sorangiineae bacterium]|nr:tetratricopeptide repeat protein [Sorangiineae bacterium]